jgi:ribosome-binding factor A
LVSRVRAQRIGDRIREELSVILITQSSDPRLTGVYVTGVVLDRELEFATVYVSAVEGAVRAKEILEGLEHAQGFLRSELAHRIVLRMFPRLRFRWDTTYEHADKIERLFRQLHEHEDAPLKGADNGRLSRSGGETALNKDAKAGTDE